MDTTEADSSAGVSCAAAYDSEAPEEQMDDNHAICPYCRHENHVEAEEYDSNEREQECAECGKTYLQYDDFTVTHYTRPCPQNVPALAQSGGEKMPTEESNQ